MGKLRLLVLVAVVSCSDGAGKGAGANLPLLTPPVRAATPLGLGGGSVPAARSATGIGRKLLALDSADLKSRFFTAGPTSIFRILADVDARIEEINMGSQGNDTACLSQEPVAYPVTPFGQALTFYAQCYRTFPTPGASAPSFFQFGQKDGVTYLYVASGVQHVAARLTPASPTNAQDAGLAIGAYRADIWIGVGYENASSCGPMTGFDSCSYGAIELHADEARAGLELSVAGIGFGYCGAQLKSDGTNVYATGSLDMGTSCVATSTLCVAASDVTTPATCGPTLTTFATPALGRLATTGSNGAFAASQYPGGANNQIVLNGTASDSLRFGPSAPSEGVGEFTGGSAKSEPMK